MHKCKNSPSQEGKTYIRKRSNRTVEYGTHFSKLTSDASPPVDEIEENNPHSDHKTSKRRRSTSDMEVDTKRRSLPSKCILIIDSVNEFALSKNLQQKQKTYEPKNSFNISIPYHLPSVLTLETIQQWNSSSAQMQKHQIEHSTYGKISSGNGLLNELFPLKQPTNTSNHPLQPFLIKINFPCG